MVAFAPHGLTVPPPVVSTLNKTQLIEALRVTTKAVRVIRLNGELEQGISPERAAVFARSGCFVGYGSSTRVKRIVEFDPRPKNAWERCFRNSEAAVLPPSPEYLNSLRSGA